MGGGGAWEKNHQEILDHARDLHYDHVPGITLPAADASRETWTTSMDAFNDWKAREKEKESAGQAWWQTYSGGDGGDGGGKPPSGGKGPPDWDDPDPGTGTGPYPESNIYFPMLVPEYNDPKAQDWSQYMPQGQSGLLYQPWSQEYGEQFMQPNIWDYQPPELKVGRPEYYQNPLGIMDVTDYVPPSETPPTTTNPNDDVENRGGKGLEQYGDLAGLGTWQGDKFADIYGNVWDGDDFDNDTELAAMVSYGNPNATKAFNDWQGWDTKPGQTVSIGDLLGGLFGGGSGTGPGPDGDTGEDGEGHSRK
jgi:hypothetical protein